MTAIATSNFCLVEVAGTPGPAIKFGEFIASAVKTASGEIGDRSPVTISHPLLNGVPYATFRREIDIDTRRELGAFFSSDDMSRRLAIRLTEMLDADCLVLDPTCGIGDLLLARAAVLPLGANLEATLALWGERLAGFDIREDLVDLCKVRLCMLARARGGFTDQTDPLEAFPQIVAQDMTAPESRNLLRRADAILFNPPFGKTTWPERLDWASGEINAAAIFLDYLIASVRPDVPIAAVLPEVLRCGSRYNRFRTRLSKLGYSGSFEVHGRFDSWTDVDVFSTLLSRSETPSPLWKVTKPHVGTTVADLYEVRVGSVVPHRDPVSGPPRAYICAKTTPAWHAAFMPSVRLAYSGKVFTPPFVAIRRTSSPSDKFRAVATVIVGDDAVAVENHLLVAMPRENGVAACEALVAVLRSPETNTQLNELMRCRHLTTGAIKRLRWIASDE
ncbi:hypothetical protein VQ045_20765 [Aurantimonas sp. E1-2-R+4]|uniref:hypothetical protein n=1 Tax=Aurantimonas sp. E1-2-R+4 TaxID=3113714 RepID=UPI002F95ADA6